MLLGNDVAWKQLASPFGTEFCLRLCEELEISELCLTDEQMDYQSFFFRRVWKLLGREDRCLLRGIIFA